MKISSTAACFTSAKRVTVSTGPKETLKET
jgi:hypothetical protein